MPAAEKKKTVSFAEFLPFSEEHYRVMRRKQVVRLLLMYVAPVAILAAFFLIQYDAIVRESKRLHLQAIAESQANTLELFLSERLVNLSNLIDDPRHEFPPTSEVMEDDLDGLRKNSNAFVDIGFFDSTGVQTSYAGPYPSLEKRNYRQESWYKTLYDDQTGFIITDIYLGFRQRPHFTIAVSRTIDGAFVVLRATLAPEEIYNYLRSQTGSAEAITSIVNQTGNYQLATPRLGTPLEASSFVPPQKPDVGAGEARIDGRYLLYGYSWLQMANWAVIVQPASTDTQAFLSGFRLRIIIISVLFVLFGFVVAVIRARKLVDMQMESDRTRAQLGHAAKLASVGELASGIAHEINNPLAVITEESGLLMDYMDPQFGHTLDENDLHKRLSTIQESAFRCRDITRKLLRFVRRTDFDLQEHDVHDIINGVIDDLLGPEIEVSSIAVERNYDRSLPKLTTDSNQLQQVILNIVNNASDAIGDEQGTITITTSSHGNRVRISIKDTGCGMIQEQLDKVFMPFFTTKEVGKGTGLGLSVSYGIVRGLGGEIEVESTKGVGTTFTLVLPVKQKR